MLERELTDFGERIGILNLAWGEGDALTLTFDDLGALKRAGPQSAEDAVVLTLSRPPPPPQPPPPVWGVVRPPHWTSRQPYALAAGMHNDRWILGIKLPLARVSGAELESALRHLLQLETSLFEGR